jgi:hypothetical protein
MTFDRHSFFTQINCRFDRSFRDARVNANTTALDDTLADI